MHSHQDVACPRIKHGVAGAATEFDLLEELVSLRVDDGICVPVFILHKDPLGARRVRDAVRIIDRPSLRHSP